ncbi:hypothetical protein EDEG_03203 [Edhazardia aedis USNM 41457]|uniref:Ferritin n=1 Tax=Edhazardia aedis (strain USNM 41457) TaxID=1003232 RepID=J9D3E2_EDHAE|nr:hypothetical protein EDEG_03203 [Edhazardia aedis USNM 41457]|eukprot:EJW02366.1 hypothetical protein EDEG_03203 [Edhazardia aedis USNM 41457]
MNNEWQKKASELLSKHLNNEMRSFYMYHAFAAIAQSSKFSCSALKRFFTRQYKEELKHAEGVIEYMNQRDFEIKYEKIELSVNLEELSCPMMLFKLCLENEEKEKEDILSLYKIADENGDVATCLFLDPYVKEQYKSIKEIKDWLATAERCNKSLACCMLEGKLNALEDKKASKKN